jgi:hypothetical protein
MWFFSDTLQVVSILLQCILLTFLLFQSYIRTYPVLFTYRLAYLMTTVIEVSVAHQFGKESGTYRQAYWTDEVLVDLLQFLLVIAMTYRAVGGSSMRVAAGRFLGVVVGLVAVLPFVLFGHSFSTRWFYNTSQLLNFGAAVMNLALWTALVGSKRRDPQLLVVSAGLGLAVTTNAIVFGVMNPLPPGVRPAVVVLHNVMDVVTLAIWCWAFRPLRRSEAPKAAGALPSEVH